MLSLVGCWKKEPRPEPFTTLTVDYISHIAHLVESYHIRTQPTQRWGRHSWSIIDIWFRGDAMLIFVLLPSYFYSNADAICCNFSEHDSVSLPEAIFTVFVFFGFREPSPKPLQIRGNPHGASTARPFGQRRFGRRKKREDKSVRLGDGCPHASPPNTCCKQMPTSDSDTDVMKAYKEGLFIFKQRSRLKKLSSKHYKSPWHCPHRRILASLIKAAECSYLQLWAFDLMKKNIVVKGKRKRIDYAASTT